MDKARILKLLEDVKRQADFMERVTAKELDRFLASEEEMYSLRYSVIQAVESMASVCVHLMAKAFGISAEGYADCFQRLGDKGVISNELGTRLAAMARLRNLVVHRYWDVDDARIFVYCREGVKDLREFVKNVAAFVGGLL